MPSLDTVVKEIAEEMRQRPDRGEVASYIPELARVDPGAFGIAVIGADGSIAVGGDADTPFSIQSISKVFTLTLALGKVLLADLSEHVLDELLRDMEFVQCTPNTITEEQALREDLSLIRQLGYAVDREELSLGLRCVAAPIRDSSGKAIAALSISGPVTRWADDDLPLLGELLIEAVSSISGNLGYFDLKCT